MDAGAIDYAYLWANVSWTLHAAPGLKGEIVPDYVPEDHWNIAVAMRKHDVELKKRVDEAIATLVKDGRVPRTLRRYHVPYFAPFDDKKDDDGVIRQPKTDRGLEPQMQKVQTSRHPYGGLERVRSAGALVVGLDPKNLPFSTAHPEPAGLDYDVAKLLAEKLGVMLRVYWAPSAHNSYPSKLASNKLCDIMVGLMPDDRFGDRVLFSRPYALASYRLVVPAGEVRITRLDQLGDEAVAVEPGVVVRGLQGRKTREYRDLENVLEAVATKQVKAGYVISTRGHYLAESIQSGKLAFHDGDKADRFPICAAVRKSDRDLKAAIDQALVELAESGKLAAVYALENPVLGTVSRPAQQAGQGRG